MSDVQAVSSVGTYMCCLWCQCNNEHRVVRQCILMKIYITSLYCALLSAFEEGKEFFERPSVWDRECRVESKVIVDIRKNRKLHTLAMIWHSARCPYRTCTLHLCSRTCTCRNMRVLLQCPKWVQPRWVTLCLKYRDVAYTSRKSSQESRTLGDHLTIFISCVQVHVDRAPQQNPKATGPGKELIRTVFQSPLVWLLPSSCPSRILHPLLSSFLRRPLHALVLLKT